MKRRLLDLCCNAGGASYGYSLAGFDDIVGVDIVPQPNYPFEFIQDDILNAERVDFEKFDCVHVSPPCQRNAAITLGTNAHLREQYVELYYPVVELLQRECPVPWVIENPIARQDIMLCGEMFGLGVIRHRRLELGGWWTDQPAHVEHRGYVRGWRHGEYRDGPYIAAYGKGGGKGEWWEIQEAMGIHWTDVHEELVEMLPPAYTEWVGKRFFEWRDAQ